jgi:hypothetical protein
MEASKTLEQAERRSKRASWTMKAMAVAAWVAYTVLLVAIMRKGIHQSNNIIDDIQIEQLAVVTLQLIEPKPRDQAVLEEQFRAVLPTALRLIELTRDFLDEKKRTNPEK